LGLAAAGRHRRRDDLRRCADGRRTPPAAGVGACDGGRGARNRPRRARPGCHCLIPSPGMQQPGYADNKAALVTRLHRIEGQVRGIEKMVDEERYCIDILTQISAATTALESLAVEILDDHVRHCVAGALASGDEPDAAAS